MIESQFATFEVCLKEQGGMPNPRLAGDRTGIEIPISKSQIPNNPESPNDQISKQIRLGHLKLGFGQYLGFGAWKLALPQRSRYFVAI
jgi:hypothetical protein